MVQERKKINLHQLFPSNHRSPHLVHSECHTLSWGGAPGEQEDRMLSSAPAGAEEQGLRDHPWRDPCTPLTGHRSPGMTPGGYGPTAAVNPGGPTEGLGTWLLSWDTHPLLLLEQAEGQPDTAQDSASLLGSPCAPWPPDAPSLPLDPVHFPWGEGCPCWAEWAVGWGWGVQSQLRPAGCLDGAGQPSERGRRNRVWGSDGVPELHHRHGCPHQGLLQHASLQLCHPLGQRCQSGG